ncbi:MAG TPA: glycoside hydrolase family 99-like domain-containing protein, partial [Candidatus Gastranaerophilaceae bacterium]|nr:glycoside hydrolase family 99-like domain-containing protein [Candidatus Gastranaerophilaceae bacterium]
ELKMYENYFDYIICGDVLEHLYNPLDVIICMKHFLQSDGHFIISLPNIAHGGIKLNLLKNKFNYNDYGLLDKTHIRFFSLKSIIDFMTNASLEIIDINMVVMPIENSIENVQEKEHPIEIVNYIKKDIESYVYQYVIKSKISKLDMQTLFEKNFKKTLLSKEEKQMLMRNLILSEMPHKKLWGSKLRPFLRNLKKKFLPPPVIKTQKIPNTTNIKMQKLVRKFLQISNKYIIKNINRILSKLKNPLFLKTLYINASEKSSEYVNGSKINIKLTDDTMKLIAFYLPQFHPIDENDKWWGKGFTEWINVTKAVPQFLGHYQPHLPDELGFYDLRLNEIMYRQIELAKQYGIYGFCFHYYWFSGKRLLEKPIFDFLNNKELNFPFCLCWANENWTRRWDGQDNEILISQTMEDGDDIKFIEDIIPFFKDSRYIRINNKPVLIIYRIHLYTKEKVQKIVRNWRNYCKQVGIGDLHLIAALTHGFFDNPSEWGLDAAIEFPPHNMNLPNISNYLPIMNPNFKGAIYDLSKYFQQDNYLKKNDFTIYRTVFPNWDNTARLPNNGSIFLNANPETYKKWLSDAIKFTKTNYSKEDQFVFINAWNEWAEGAHLEPDAKYGYAYLNETKKALENQFDKN